MTHSIVSEIISSWKGSIYKLVWRHFVVYYVLYVSLTAVYEFLLNDTGRRWIYISLVTLLKLKNNQFFTLDFFFILQALRSADQVQNLFISNQTTFTLHFNGLLHELIKFFKIRYFSKSASTLNLMIMLGFFTSTTLQRLFTMQTAIPGTAKPISSFVMSLKADLPEVIVYS